jgi:hypothetical protein
MKRVSHIDWSVKNYPNVIRAGIIPYVQQSHILFFAFSIDSNIASLGDFGGHYDPTDCDLLDTAIREYREEALNVFGIVTRDSLKDCYALIGLETIEILLPVPPPFYQYTQNFNSMIIGQKNHEVQNIVWFSLKQLLVVIDNQEGSFAGTKLFHMYTRLHQCLLQNRNIFVS